MARTLLNENNLIANGEPKMKCPIDEALMIDYLEGCCEAELAGEVRRHLERCPVCRREYDSLSRMHKILAGSAGDLLPEEPPESFWRENAQAVAEATYLQPAGLERRFSARFPRAAVTGAIAAAAVLVLAITWLLELESWQPGPGKEPVLVSQEAQVSTEQAMMDSLWMLWREMQEFEMAANAMESIYDLELEEDNGAHAEEFMFSTGSSVYEGLDDLNEEQLQQVVYLAAGY